MIGIPGNRGASPSGNRRTPIDCAVCGMKLCRSSVLSFEGMKEMNEVQVEAEILGLAKKLGILEMKSFQPEEVWKPALTRLKFETEEQALAHRAKVGTGGWVLGPFLFPGSWTPTLVMQHSEGVEGELK